MSGWHGPRHGSVADALYVPGSSALHRLPPHVALVGAVGFVVAVVATPPSWQAYAGFAVVLAGLAAVARVPYALVLQRSVVELPFVAFALLLPFVATGPHTEVLGLSVSSSGLADGATLLARATLGVWTSILLAATQRPVALLRGLERLRVPGVLVQIAGLMLRYLEVVLGEMRRMRVAREARGFRARDLRQLPTLAHAAGSLFIRSYERGERVHLAMLSRGYQGSMPDLGAVTDPRRRGATARTGARMTAGGTTFDRVGPALRVRDLSFAYPDGHQVLYGIDLAVAAGERVALLGPNGAGKTTLVLHLNGILTAGRGSVQVAGLEVGPDTVQEVRRRVGVVFQDPDDQLFMPTVAEDVAFGPANHGLRGEALRARVDEALAAVGMAHVADRPPHHLSFGQRRRVAVATVLAMRPEILVLDEPSSNLDPASRRELAEILESLPVAVLMVTHDLPYALQLCGRSVLLDDGAVVADAPTRTLLADEALLTAHRLELPYALDRTATT